MNASQLNGQRCGLANLRHGKCGSRIYKVWGSMLERCRNPSHHAYARYGGRGIKICKRWQVFENFYADMGDHPMGKSLDRIDNDKGYFPKNCRWATPEEQQNNTQAAHILKCDGSSLSISQWARKLNISRNRIRTRLQKGWSVRDALFRPKIKGRPR